MVLNIEVDEYIDSLTHGSGVLIDIRPFNTLPFSERSTMTIAPGREYFIGLQLVCSIQGDFNGYVVKEITKPLTNLPIVLLNM